MQYLRPQWVLPLEQAGDGRAHAFKISALREGWVWTQRDWLKATDDTGVGDPSLSTPEKGQPHTHTYDHGHIRAHDHTDTPAHFHTHTQVAVRVAER